MTDISFDLGGYTINLRVAAVIVRGDDVVVCRARPEDWWYLPGGRIKTNETSVQALTRELREEMGEHFQIRRPIVCAENFFTLHGVSVHEICTFYEVDWLDDALITPSEGANEVIEWMPRNRVMTIDLKPEFIKPYVLNPPPQLELVIYRDSQ